MILPRMSAEDYHARPEISASGIKLLSRSPAHFHHPAKAIGANTARIGHLVHAVVLEDGLGVVITPTAAKNTNAGKAEWATWFDEHDLDGIEIVKMPAADWLPELQARTGLIGAHPNEHDDAVSMRESVLRAAGALLETGEAEVSMTGEIDGTPVRARFDWICAERGIIVDLKTAVDATADVWRWSAARNRYSVQEAVYREIAAQNIDRRVERFVFVVVEKEPPFVACCYELDFDTLMNGDWIMRRNLETYRECERLGVWPGPPGDASLALPILEHEPEIALTSGGESI